jgi:hypothetical protein
VKLGRHSEDAQNHESVGHKSTRQLRRTARLHLDTEECLEGSRSSEWEIQMELVSVPNPRSAPV